MKKRILLIALILTSLISCKKEEYTNLKDGLYAKIKTSKGDIICQLEFEKTPITVANYVSLAEGKNTFVSPEYKGKKLFDGLKFHRVLDNFMIQGGDPLGNGTGDAGCKFKDEFTDLKHDVPGIMSMANSGPGTNGSQFFITHVPTPWLDGKHTVFGHVIQGQNIVDSIKGNDVLKHLVILRKGKEAEEFDAAKTFEFEKTNAGAKAEAKAKAEAEKMDKTLNETYGSAKATASGLRYIIEKEGEGEAPKATSSVTVHYTGYLLNGSKFDSSVDRGQPATFGLNQVIPGWTEGLQLLKPGGKAKLIIPANLGYGANGYPPVIPTNSWLVFDVELIKVN